MTDEQLLKLASAITSGLVADKWWVYLIALALMVIVAALGPLLVEYFKTKGKNYATRADFDELLSQIRKTTEAQEEIKTAVSHNDWRAREYLQIRRQKLEEVIYSIHDCNAWLKNRALTVPTSEQSATSNPIPKLAATIKLYFPELPEAWDLSAVAAELNLFLEKAQFDIGNATAAVEAVSRQNNPLIPSYHLQIDKARSERRRVMDEALSQYKILDQKLTAAILNVEKRAGEIMTAMIKPPH